MLRARACNQRGREGHDRVRVCFSRYYARWLALCVYHASMRAYGRGGARFG
jgi:hypothetical protein